jgi:hypothetical protein
VSVERFARKLDDRLNFTRCQQCRVPVRLLLSLRSLNIGFDHIARHSRDIFNRVQGRPRRLGPEKATNVGRLGNETARFSIVQEICDRLGILFLKRHPVESMRRNGPLSIDDISDSWRSFRWRMAYSTSRDPVLVISIASIDTRVLVRLERKYGQLWYNVPFGSTAGHVTRDLRDIGFREFGRWVRDSKPIQRHPMRLRPRNELATKMEGGLGWLQGGQRSQIAN